MALRGQVNDVGEELGIEFSLRPWCLKEGRAVDHWQAKISCDLSHFFHTLNGREKWDAFEGRNTALIV